MANFSTSNWLGKKLPTVQNCQKEGKAEKRAIRNGHTSFFGLGFSDFKLVPVNLALNSASKCQTYFYHKCGHGTDKTSQTWKSKLKLYWNVFNHL